LAAANPISLSAMPHRKSPLTHWLEEASPGVFTLAAGTAAFATYFSMYAFRKPFAAAPFDGTVALLGATVQFKTALVISQIIGYAISKYLGIKVCSEAVRTRRATTLVGLILAAEVALVLFGLFTGPWKVLAIFLNGIPLGMVWGLVVGYLEGRRTTEIMLAMLACSFIVASGAVKDVGLWLMRDLHVAEGWMPALTGLLFLPLLCGSVWVLQRLPPPTADDVAARICRAPMRGPQRMAFVKQWLPGLALVLATYVLLTAYRDFRDNYGAEVYRSLGYGDRLGLFTQTESLIGVGVLAALALLYRVRGNRNGLLGGMVAMIVGTALVGAATLLLDAKAISGAAWMLLAGLGAYLAYVPINILFFERLIAATRVAGTAVFGIMLADALGYTGSVAVQLYKDLASAELNRFEFLREFAYVTSATGTVCLTAAAVYFAFALRPTTALERDAGRRGSAVVGPAAAPLSSFLPAVDCGENR
jgi:hypothetical protein